jgi:hypothetical protein
VTAYCATTDLLLGQIPLPSYLDAQKVVQDAADEIDSKLGSLFVTPFNVSETDDDALTRPSRLLLKRINTHLATGRLILAVANPEENRNLHAYGYYLVKEAEEALDCIVKGDVTLDGAEALESNVPLTTVPLIANVDSESSVEAFYDRIASPSYFYFPPGNTYPYPDRLVE